MVHIGSVGEETAPPSRSGRRRNDEAITEARRLRDDERLDDAAIASRLGVARTTVTRWLGPARPPGRPPASVGQAVSDARADGASWREVEQRTGVPKSTAHRRGGAGRGMTE